MLRARLYSMSWGLTLRLIVALAWLVGSQGQRLAAADDDGKVAQAVRQVLDEQAQAWNAGDVERFMQSYWNSEELSFSSGGTTTRGWQQTRQRYLQRYPDRAAMGQLTFRNLQVTELSPQAALVLGEWELQRTTDQPHGNFTLIFRQLDGKWLIVHDHTSRAED